MPRKNARFLLAKAKRKSSPREKAVKSRGGEEIMGKGGKNQGGTNPDR